MNTNNSTDRFVQNTSLVFLLNDLYRSEIVLTEALTKMSVAASSPQLAGAFNVHQTETREQDRRLRDILKTVLNGQQSEGTADEMGQTSVSPLVAQGETIINTMQAGSERDEALVAAARQVEQHEIAGYSDAIRMSRDEGVSVAVVAQLEKTLGEEQHALSTLNSLAGTRAENNTERLAGRNAEVY